MACEDSGLTVGLKPGELKMDSLWSDRRALRSQDIFLNFAGRSFGQLVDEGHSVRRLEVRDVRPCKLAQLALIGVRAFLQNNKGVRRLAPAFVRESNDRSFLHGRVSQKYAFRSQTRAARAHRRARLPSEQQRRAAPRPSVRARIQRSQLPARPGVSKVRLPISNSRSSRSSACAPSFRTTKACGASPQRSCANPTIAASCTAGCLKSTPSTSTDEMFSPPLMMTSFRRSRIST